ncbi:hypothetical protein FITA111629_11615 [Filibacter tadaridae]|uniref:Uncharacterized protein n=1 Tax=Filibacter tadaridae TaxID=2483811 RepID=A0A3P5WQZ5_9BACL|nr:hypothetical protein [Filibacter tadaridae]VDC21046.1 hypothetical protein FILTAD_00520 [Filibacter tadaridae]
MVEMQSFKIRYLILTLFAVLIALTFYYGQTFEEALFTDGFPVPGKAKILKVSGDVGSESYTWKPASEENGLPIRYKLMIFLSGWKEVDRLGTLTTYEKDAVQVDVISQTDYLQLIGPN